MHEILITQPKQKDISELKQIWMDAFGDPMEIIEAFFDRFAPGQCGWIVCHGAEILSAAYLLHGNLLLHDGKVRPAGYVYAVATPEKHRGKGYAGMLMRHFSQLAKERDLILYTRPASDSLFYWYAETMLTVPAEPLAEKTIRMQSQPSVLPVHSITPEEYGSRRETQLTGKTHILLSESFLYLQEAYLRSEHGGFYRVGEAICACELSEDTLRIKELLPNTDNAQIIQSLLRHFRVSRARLFHRSENGSPQVAYQGDRSLAGADWGLLLD